MDSISVIIPVYNRVDILERCIKSVLEQSFPVSEIILSDDGSNDGTTKLCFELAEKDSRIHALSNDHRGPSATRNAGLLRAEGDFLLFLDSDDIIAPDMIKKMHGNIEGSGAELSCCRFRMEWDCTKEFVADYGDTFLMSSKDAYEWMLFNEGNVGYGVLPGTKLIKRSLIMNPHPLLFPENISFGEDSMWIAWLLERTSSIVMDRSVLMRYSMDCENSICRHNSTMDLFKKTQWEIRYLEKHGFGEMVLPWLKKMEAAYLVRLLLEAEPPR